MSKKTNVKGANGNGAASKGAAATDIAAEYKGTKEGTAMTVTQVQVAMIDVLDGFNVRKTSTDRPDGEGAREPFRSGSDKETTIGAGSMGTSHDTLTADIKRNGLLQPVIVRPNGARFALVSGHRRFAAVRSLGWKTVPAVVRAMSEEEAYTINLTENVQREDLSPGEIADRAIMLREKFPETFAPGEKGNTAALATLIGVSKSYLVNLIRMATDLEPRIWELCRNGRNPNAPPHHKLLKWVALDSHDAQWNAYLEWTGVKAERDAEDGVGEGAEGDGEGAEATADGPTYKRPSKEALETLEMEILARKRTKPPTISDAEASVALAVVRFAIGKVGKDGQPPSAPYEAAKSPKVEKEGKAAKAPAKVATAAPAKA